MIRPSAEEYRELARRCRDEAMRSMPGPAWALRGIADDYEASAIEVEAAGG